MSNQNEAVDSTETQSPNSPGNMIRSARQQAGMSEQELADHLRLRVAIIKGIEQDQYDLASPTFMRGYLRAIAKALELDANEVLHAYEAICGDTPAETNIKMQSFSKRQIRERNDNRLKWASYIIIAIVLGAAIVWWIQESNFSMNTITGSEDAPTQAEFTASQNENPIAVRVRSQPQPVVETVNPMPTEDEVRAQVAAEETSTELETQPRAEPESQPESEPQPAAEATESEPAPEPEAEPATTEEPMLDSLVMTFSDACWVKVVDATGEEIAIGVKANGYRMPLQGQAPFDIILCKPDAVEMTYNDEPVDLSGYRRGRSVTMTLGGEQ